MNNEYVVRSVDYLMADLESRLSVMGVTFDTYEEYSVRALIERHVAAIVKDAEMGAANV